MLHTLLAVRAKQFSPCLGDVYSRIHDTTVVLLVLLYFLVFQECTNYLFVVADGALPNLSGLVNLLLVWYSLSTNQSHPEGEIVVQNL